MSTEHTITRIYFICIASLLFSECAIQVKPTGGPKDVTPPKVVNYSPDNKSLHFNTRKIRITFDEYIQVKSLEKQLIVSPPLKYAPKALVKGRVLELTLKDTLKDSSTYTFNFGNSIVDNNEGNVLRNFQYVVSTGDHIDSLSISGRVQDAFTHDSIKGAYVMLFSNLGDSAVYKSLPAYISLTDDRGYYNIQNIAPGTYRLIAISNIQTDYFYHPYVEGIGFKSRLTEIHLHDTSNLYVFTELPPRLKLIKAKAEDRGEIEMVFNKPADSLSVKALNQPDSLKPGYTHLNYSVTGDTAFYWLNTPFIDSLRFVIYHNGNALDTAFVHSFPNNSIQRKVKKPKPVKLKVVCNARNGFDFHQPISFSFGDPVLKYDMSKITLVLRNDTEKFSPDTSTMPFVFSINPARQLISDSTYQLIVLPGAFTDMFGTKNDTMKIKFVIVEPTFFGTLKLDLKFTNQGHYIVQMVDSKLNVYRQFIITGSKSVFFDALQPGTYRIRVIDDANNNGIWDTGDFMKGIQPEKVYYYFQALNIRSNWDITQSWQVK
ncbi:MAG: Ig-like domain-containing protein [Bacteroidia bacterium]